MTKIEFYTIDATCGIDQALYKIRASKTRPVFVVDNGKLAGVLFERDIRQYLVNGGDFSAKCGWLANETLFINENDMANAQDILRDSGLNVLPVVRDDGTLTDIALYENNIELCVLKREDMNFVTDFFDNLGEEGHAFFNHGDWNRVEVMKWLTSDCADKTQVYFGAFKTLDNGDRVMVGLLLLIYLDTATPWLGIAISRLSKGAGLGERLLLYADEYAKSLGAGGIFLTTAISNLRGQNLYVKMGYKRLGVHTSGEYLYFKNI